MFTDKVFCADPVKILKAIPDESVDCVVTSPPYWPFQNDGYSQRNISELETAELLERLYPVIDELQRVLKPEGICYVSFFEYDSGPSTGSHAKGRSENRSNRLIEKVLALIGKAAVNVQKESSSGIPDGFAKRMVESGWVLRDELTSLTTRVAYDSAKGGNVREVHQALVFAKRRKSKSDGEFRLGYEPRNSKQRSKDPSECYSRPNETVRTTELFTAEKRVPKQYSKTSKKESGGSVATIGSSHGVFSYTLTRVLAETMIRVACPRSGIVLDPFVGRGTNAVIAKSLSRKFIGIERRREYAILARRRLSEVNLARRSADF
ncbi:MAG: site-specific DNA-methyltransferase [Acidobacteriota bacterium]|nr:MAG: site-specific DNA-methyltransferase [Acidobacteriota bacterium]